MKAMRTVPQTADVGDDLEFLALEELEREGRLDELEQRYGGPRFNHGPVKPSGPAPVTAAIAAVANLALWRSGASTEPIKAGQCMWHLTPEQVEAVEGADLSHLLDVFKPRTKTAAVDPQAATGAMVALVPSNPVGLAVNGGLEVDDIHLTLVFFGDTNELPSFLQQEIWAAVAEWAEDEDPEVYALTHIAHMGDPTDPNTSVAYEVDGPGIHALRNRLTSRLATHAVEWSKKWSFRPHVTVTYVDRVEAQRDHPEGPLAEPILATFKVARFAWADTDYLFDLDEEDEHTARTAAFNVAQPRCPRGTGETAGRFSNSGLVNCNPQTAQLSAEGLDQREAALQVALEGAVSSRRRQRLEIEADIVDAERERRHTAEDADNPIDINEMAAAPMSNADFKDWRALAVTDNVSITNCDYCGTGIRYVVTAQNKEGDTCKLGTSCAEKVGFTAEEIRKLKALDAYQSPEAVAAREKGMAADAYREKLNNLKREMRPDLPRDVGNTDALFDLEGNLITTNKFSGQYGRAWRFREEGKSSDTYVNANPKRLSTMSKKGYYEGWVAAEMVNPRSGNRFLPRDSENNYEVNVIKILDNGQDPATAYDPYGGPDGEPVDAPWEDEIRALRKEYDAVWAEYDNTDWDALIEADGS